MHIHSPEVRVMAGVLFRAPRRDFSVKQKTIALFFIRLQDEYPEGTPWVLNTLPTLASIYRPGYASLPLNEKHAAQETVKKSLSLFASLSGKLPLVIVPVPKKAWELKDEGKYPPPVYQADSLFRGQWAIYGAHIGRDIDGAVPTAYTAANKARAKGKTLVNEARERNWTVQGMIGDDICEARALPTQKQLTDGLPALQK